MVRDANLASLIFLLNNVKVFLKIFIFQKMALFLQCYLMNNAFKIKDMKVEYKLATIDYTEKVDEDWFNALEINKAKSAFYWTKRDYNIKGARLTQHVTFGDYNQVCVELIDEWGNYIPGQDTVKHLLPVSELNNEIRKLRIYFTELCGQSWIFEIVKRVIRPSLRHPAIYASEIKGIMYICEYCAYNEETDHCSFSYELYLQEGEDPEDYIIPDTFYKEVKILPYEEWKRKTKIGISAFKGATGVK